MNALMHLARVLELARVRRWRARAAEFLAELFDNFDAARYVDVVNPHAYCETWNPEPLETLSSYVDEVQQVVQRHGGEGAIWMAEIGYGNYRNGAHVSDHTSAVFGYEHTLDYHAQARAFLTARHTLVVVAWLGTPAPPGGPRAGVGDALDPRREILRVRGPHRRAEL